ncbi:MAG: TetR/AcrR family transcriptional regulator [Lachnospiraceae bacterium]|nr:TetR/AcrR family transcriptional regulator [Lachnospiraceae bacterium]
MRNQEKDAIEMEKKRNTILEESFRLFSEKGIDPVSYADIANVCGYGTTTLHRYFPTKLDLVVAVSTWCWGRFWESNKKRRRNPSLSGMTAAEIFEYYLDSFLELYRNGKPLLRFNQYFNIYVRSADPDSSDLGSYLGMIDSMLNTFHIIYEKAQKDGTVRTDVPEQEMFSVTLHLMLAAATRYAVGLVYVPEEGYDPEGELTLLKEMLMNRYCTNAAPGSPIIYRKMRLSQLKEV